MKLAEAVKNRAITETAPAIKTILVPIDFSPASTQAFCLALQFAGDRDSTLTLLHVFEPETPLSLAGRPATATFSEEEVADIGQRLRDLISAAEATGVAGAKSMVRSGLASYEIVKAARDLDIDLIVIGTHGLTSWKHFAIGSTADRVARAAPCPVLIVRGKEHDFV